jgi:hypothetical protein
VRRGRQQRGGGDADVHADGADHPNAHDRDRNHADNHDPYRDVPSASGPAGDRDPAKHRDGHDDAALADGYAVRSGQNGHRHADTDRDSDADGHRCGGATGYHHVRRDDHLGREPGGCGSSRSGRRVQRERGDEQHAVGWIAFGILAAAVLVTGLVLWLRKRRSAPTDGGSAPPVSP